jgi:ADP-heptose:LPS heptosyltransferase
MNALPEAPRKVLVMELAGLGDNVHLLPALWLVRQRWPQAELHVMASAHAADLFKLTPWVQRVWAYPRSPRAPGFFANLGWGRRLREAGFDVVINTTGSDRSSLLTWLSRAPVRIGRRPSDGGPVGWRFFFTQIVEQPFYREPMYLQKWKLMQDAGLPRAAQPEFHVTIDPAWRRAADIAADDEGRYLHFSPNTTADKRELPLAQQVELLRGLREHHPRLRLALSCAPNDREKAKLEALVAGLGFAPWRVYPGTLDVPRLAAVIEKAVLHLCGDTGSLHVALMTQTPTVAWFRAHKGQHEWIPLFPQYRVIIGDGGAEDALHGIETSALLDAAHLLIRSYAE